MARQLACFAGSRFVSLRRVPPVLQVLELSIRRGRTTILDRVSWTVEHREQWTILGANGSGKTSLLAALTGYLSPTSGEIRVLGETFGQSDWRELRCRIGMVSSSVRQLMHDDEPALVTVASGKYATIGHWGAIPHRELAEARRRLAEVGAPDLADRRWEVLSQGERQRVLIARALMAQPRLLILDEPCAGLDPLARERFLELIDELTRAATAPALVFVTHHVEEIMPRFTHALLLRAGKVAAQGVKERVLTTRNLTETFGAPLEVRRRRGRYSLKLRESAGAIRII